MDEQRLVDWIVEIGRKQKIDSRTMEFFLSLHVGPNDETILELIQRGVSCASAGSVARHVRHEGFIKCSVSSEVR